MSDPHELAAQASAAMRDGRVDDAKDFIGQLYVERAFRRAARIAYVSIGSPKALDADDLEHEVYILVQKGIADYDSDGGNFYAWLAKIAHNCLISLLRKTNRFPSTLDELPEGQTEATQSHAEFWRQESNVALTTPFSKQDWDCLLSWGERNGRDPLLVIVGHGFWSKVSNDPDLNRREHWRDWCAACDIDDHSELEKRLDELVAMGDLDNQLKVLRDYLSLSDAAFRKDWNRKQHLVAELQAFWDFYLVEVELLTDQQVADALETEVCSRIPILCIDQHWHRSRNAAQWKSFRDNFKFNGIPPLLRFIPRSSLSDRVELFARSMPGEFEENTRRLYQKLKLLTPFRQGLSSAPN